MPELVFVYGTLKEGFPNHGRNNGRRLGGHYRTRLPFPLYVVRLANEDRAPWLVCKPGAGSRVIGQVFEVDSAGLVRMDAFEEVGLATGYVRGRIELEAVDGMKPPVHAHVYMKQQHQLADCLAREGPYEEYTHALAVGYRLALESAPSTPCDLS